MDDGAFSREICGQHAFLVSWIRGKFHISTTDAEDVVQETMLRAWASRGRYDDQLKIRAWLMTIAFNYLVSQKRRAWRVQLTDDMGMYETGTNGNQFDALYLKEVLAEMVKLPPDQLDAIVFLARGEQYNETGELMEAKDGTIKSRVARGRRALREALE